MSGLSWGRRTLGPYHTLLMAAVTLTGVKFLRFHVVVEAVVWELATATRNRGAATAQGPRGLLPALPVACTPHQPRAKNRTLDTLYVYPKGGLRELVPRMVRARGSASVATERVSGARAHPTDSSSTSHA